MQTSRLPLEGKFLAQTGINQQENAPFPSNFGLSLLPIGKTPSPKEFLAFQEAFVLILPQTRIFLLHPDSNGSISEQQSRRQWGIA